MAALLTLASALLPALARSAPTVFACEPEWAALVRTLLPTARVFVATHAGQDPHHIEARPALIAQLRSADLAVCTGAELESGWLPVLQQRAGNPRAQDVFFAATHVPLLGARPGAVATPWSGDVHAAGNPHLHTDPQRMLQVAAALAQRMQREWPAEAAGIESRRSAFEAAWRARMAQWQQQAVPLRGQRVAAQHSTFAYLWAWLGMQQVADLEPQPGMAPTPGHLQRLLDTLRSQPPAAVVIASHHDARAARWLTSQLGPAVPLRVLPATVAEDADGSALMRWMDDLLAALGARAGASAAPR